MPGLVEGGPPYTALRAGKQRRVPAGVHVGIEVILEIGNDRLGHRDVADACGRLPTPYLDAGRQLLPLLGDEYAAMKEVEIAPRQAEKLTEAQPAGRRQEHERSVRRVNGLGERKGFRDGDQRPLGTVLSRSPAQPAAVLGDEVVLGGGVEHRHEEPIALRRLQRAHAV